MSYIHGPIGPHLLTTMGHSINLLVFFYCFFIQTTLGPSLLQYIYLYLLHNRAFLYSPSDSASLLCIQTTIIMSNFLSPWPSSSLRLQKIEKSHQYLTFRQSVSIEKCKKQCLRTDYKKPLHSHNNEMSLYYDKWQKSISRTQSSESSIQHHMLLSMHTSMK